MNMVPVQNVIPGLIEPFPVLALIVTCLVGDQQPFAFLTNASHGNDAWGGADAVSSKEYRLKRAISEAIMLVTYSDQFGVIACDHAIP